jgi:hypothetical protein
MMCVTGGRVIAFLSMLLSYVSVVEESNVHLMKLVGENSIFCDSKYGSFTRKDKINIA